MIAKSKNRVEKSTIAVHSVDNARVSEISEKYRIDKATAIKLLLDYAESGNGNFHEYMLSRLKW